MACVSNFGAFANWTGHVLAQSNSYGFGRLSWSGSTLTSNVMQKYGLFSKAMALITSGSG